jgi:hypothetical protein
MRRFEGEQYTCRVLSFTEVLDKSLVYTISPSDKNSYFSAHSLQTSTIAVYEASLPSNLDLLSWLAFTMALMVLVHEFILFFC